MTNKLITVVVFVMSLFVCIVEWIVFSGENYAIIAGVLAVFAVMPYLASHGNRQAVTKEIWIIIVMTVISFVILRTAQNAAYFRPFTAVTIAAGMYFGAASGYTCGFYSVLVSSLLAGLAPWDVFSILLMAFLGLLAAMFSEQLSESKAFMSVFTALSSISYSSTGLLSSVWEKGEGFDFSLLPKLVFNSMLWFTFYAAIDILILFVIRYIFGKKAERMKKRYRIFEYARKI